MNRNTKIHFFSYMAQPEGIFFQNNTLYSWLFFPALSIIER